MMSRKFGVSSLYFFVNIGDIRDVGMLAAYDFRELVMRFFFMGNDNEKIGFTSWLQMRGNTGSVQIFCRVCGAIGEHFR